VLSGSVLSGSVLSAAALLTLSGAALTADSALTFPSVRGAHRTLEPSGKAERTWPVAVAVADAATQNAETRNFDR
jgi:predicted ATP-grasp superfamily ATP-dependent carboligase